MLAENRLSNVRDPVVDRNGVPARKLQVRSRHDREIDVKNRQVGTPPFAKPDEESHIMAFLTPAVSEQADEVLGLDLVPVVQGMAQHRDPHGLKTLSFHCRQNLTGASYSRFARVAATSMSSRQRYIIICPGS